MIIKNYLCDHFKESNDVFDFDYSRCETIGKLYEIKSNGKASLEEAFEAGILYVFIKYKKKVLFFFKFFILLNKSQYIYCNQYYIIIIPKATIIFILENCL